MVIAGAGSGKTTLMAARVVWLVATGQVAPDEVLGLTFTTKAAAELRDRGSATALRAAGLLPEPRPRRRRRRRGGRVEPTVATYNAYAAGLLTEHGLRIGHEPDTRVIADASRYQLARPVVAPLHRRRSSSSATTRDRDPVPARPRRRDERAPRRRPTTCAPSTPRERAARSRRSWPAETPQDLPRARSRRRSTRSTGARELLGLVEAYRRLKRDLGLMDFSDQIALGRPAGRRAARGRRGSSARSSGSCSSTSTRTPRSPRRCMLQPAVLRARRRRTAAATPVTRGRRPQPGDLRLARRLGVQHPRLRRRLPARRRRPTSPTYPLTVNRRSDAPHPRGRQPRSPPRSTPTAPELRAARAEAGRRPRRRCTAGVLRDLRRRARLAGRRR